MNGKVIDLKLRRTMGVLSINLNMEASAMVKLPSYERLAVGSLNAAQQKTLAITG